MHPPDIALLPDAPGALDLACQRGGVGVVHGDVCSPLAAAKGIDADQDLLARLEALLLAQCGAHNALLHQARRDGLADPHLQDFVNNRSHVLLSSLRQRLHVVGARQGIDSLGNPALIGDDLLRA